MFGGVNAKSNQSVFQAKSANWLVKYTECFHAFPYAGFVQWKPGVRRIQRPMKFDESVIEVSNKLNIFFGAKVWSIPAQMVISETLQYQLRPVKVLRMDKKIQIGK